jgi:putative transposase
MLVRQHNMSDTAPCRIHTSATHTIESINFQLRKITKHRGYFRIESPEMKLLYLGLRNISSPSGGTLALNTLTKMLPGRVPSY